MSNTPQPQCQQLYNRTPRRFRRVSADIQPICTCQGVLLEYLVVVVTVCNPLVSGDGTTETQLNPVKIMEDVVLVSAGVWHTVAVDKDGILWEWGDNRNGQLGDGTTISRYSPERIMDNIMISP